VLAGVDDVVVPPAYDPKRELPPAEFQTMLDQDYLSRTRSGVWFPEWGSEGIRYASVDSWQEYHLLVCIHMTTNEVRIEYVESRNMKEHAGRVEERARRLDQHPGPVHRALARAALREREETP